MLAHLADNPEHPRGLGLRGRERGRRPLRGEGPRQLRLEPGPPLGRRGRRRLAAGPGPPQRRERLVRPERVFPHVEAERAEAEGLDLPAHGSHQVFHRAHAAHGGETRLQHAQVRDQLVRGPVPGLPPPRPGGPLLRAGEGDVEALQHAGAVLPEHLAGVPRPNPLGVARALELAGQGCPELLRDRRRPLGHAQHVQQVGEPPAIAAQAHEPVLLERLTGHFVRDERIAVPVAADPRPELEEWGDFEPGVWVGVPQRAVELVQQLRDNVEQVLGDEVQAPRAFLRDRRLREPQLAGEPQQLDLGAQLGDEVGALAGSPARRFQVHQPAVDAAVFLEHRHPLRLGRMSRDDRAHPEARDHAPQLLHRDPHLRRRRHHLGEGAAQPVVAPLHFALPPLPHRGVLLGDGQQLEPHALRLDGACQQPGRSAHLDGLAAQTGLALGLVDPNHVDELVEEKVRDLLEVALRRTDSKV